MGLTQTLGGVQQGGWVQVGYNAYVIRFSIIPQAPVCFSYLVEQLSLHRIYGIGNFIDRICSSPSFHDVFFSVSIQIPCRTNQTQTSDE